MSRAISIMLRPLRLLRAQPEIALPTQPSPSYFLAGKRFRQVAAEAHKFPQNSEKMAHQAHSPNTEFGDTLSSLGKEYATRCEEEGFGGTYVKNSNPWKDDEEEYGGHAIANAPPDHEGKLKYEKKDGNQTKAAT